MRRRHRASSPCSAWSCGASPRSSAAAASVRVKLGDDVFRPGQAERVAEADRRRRAAAVPRTRRHGRHAGHRRLPRRHRPVHGLEGVLDRAARRAARPACSQVDRGLLRARRSAAPAGTTRPTAAGLDPVPVGDRRGGQPRDRPHARRRTRPGPTTALAPRTTDLTPGQRPSASGAAEAGRPTRRGQRQADLEAGAAAGATRRP